MDEKDMELKVVNEMPEDYTKPRFVSMHGKWREAHPEDPGLLEVPRASFEDVVYGYVLSARTNAAHRSNRAAIRRFLETAQSMSCGVDIPEKLETINAFTWQMVEARRVDNTLRGDNGSTISFFVNPEHMMAEIKLVYGDQPASGAIAMILVWMGVNAADARNMLDEALSPDSTVLTYRKNEIKVPELFVQVLKQYRKGEYAYSPQYDKSCQKIKGVYLLQRSLRWNQVKSSLADRRDPVKESTIYRHLNDMNRVLSQKHGTQILYSLVNAEYSSMFYACRKAVEKGYYTDADAYLEEVYPSDGARRNRLKTYYEEYTKTCQELLPLYPDT